MLETVADSVAMSDEKRLIKSLLRSYETVGVVGRPVLNHSETIKVYYGLSLIQILDLDEKNQVLQTNVWSRYVSRFYCCLLLYYSCNNRRVRICVVSILKYLVID